MNYSKCALILSLIIGAASAGLAAQQNAKAVLKAFQGQSSSTIGFDVKDGAETIEIANVAYETAGPGIPGRPPEDRLVLRKTTHTKQIIGDIGIEASTTVEAWPLGTDLQQKPLYSLTVPGAGCRILEGLLEISRGLEEVEWWSVYKLGTGAHLFDTHVPLMQFSIARDVQTLRYAGLEAPEDDAADARLRDPHIVAMLTYASADRVIREALITSDDPKWAQLLRSYADATRRISLVERESAAAVGKKTNEPSRSLNISISRSYPAAPASTRPRHPEFPGRRNRGTFGRRGQRAPGRIAKHAERA